MAITATFKADFSSFLQAVDKAEVALVDMSKGASKAESSLNKMVDSFSGRKLIQEAVLLEKAIGEVGGVSKLTAKELQTAGAKAAEAAEKMKKLGLEVPPGLQKIVAEAKKLESGFGGPLLDSVKKFGPAIATAFSLTAVVAAGKKVLDFAGNLTDMSAKTGISTTGLQKLQLAFEQSGVGIDTVTAATLKLANNLVSGDKSAVSALTKLGLSADQLKTLAPEQQFLKVADAVGKIQNPTEKAYAAMQIFGKGGAELLAGLTGNLEETTNKFEEMGVIIDEETIAAADDFGDQLAVLEKLGMAFIANVLAPLLPGLAALAQWLMKAATAAIALAQGFEDNLIKAFMQAGIWFDKFLLAVAEGSQKIPILGQYLGASAETVASLRENVTTAELALNIFSTTTEKTGEKAKTATAPLLGLGAAAEDTEKNAKKLREELEKHTSEVHKVEAAFFGLTQSVGQASDAELDFVRGSVAMRAELDKVEETAHIANFGFKSMADGLEHLGTKVTDVGPDVAHMFVGPIQEGAKKAGPTLGATMKDLGGSMTGTFASALEGGGGIGGAISSMATQALSKVAAFIPVIGPIISQFAGPIVAGVKKLFGGVSEAEKKARDDIKKFEAQLASTLTVTQKAEAGNKPWAMTTIAVRDAYLAAGKSAAEAEAAVKRLWDSSKKGAAETQAAIEAVNAVMDEQKQDTEDLQAAVERYGFSIEELGPAMQKQKLDEQAKQLLNDWRLLVGAGIDLTVVNEKMAESVNDYLKLAKKTGMEVPEAMKPILQSMIDQGLLFDENGNKITDMAQLGITFSETMTAGFDRVVSKLQQLLDKIAGVGPEINKIPRTVDIDVNYHEHGKPDTRDSEYAAQGGLVTPHGIVQYLAGGGNVFRPRGSDTVPAMLTPGELVLSRSQARAYLGGRGGGGGNESLVVHSHLHLDGREIAASTERLGMEQLRRERRLNRTA